MATRLILALVLFVGGAGACWADVDPYYAPYEWYGPVLGLPTAWGISQGSPGVTVAVLDSGVMANTPDLAGRLMTPLVSPGLPVLDGTANHHGTWVASVAGMGVHNGIGGAGVGNFAILPVVVTDSFGHNTPNWVAGGIRIAADAGAHVINVSQIVTDYGPLDSAAAYAKTKGALVFVAAGNSNARNPMSGYDNLVFVSGTNSSDQRWSEATEGSTYGLFVDLSAPADNILVADPTFASGYGLGHGTSFATPLTAGAAALLWSIDPSLTPDEVQDILYKTATDLGDPGWDEVYGWGRLNVGAAAERAYELSLAPEPGTLLLLAAGLAAPLARRLRRRP